MEIDIRQTELWIKSIYNINRELDFERECAKKSIERIEYLERQKEEIFSIFEKITNPTYKQILHKRYVQGKKWEEIEEELNYASQHLHRLHRKAILEIHKVRTGQI